MVSKTSSGFEEIRHTADWAVRVWAESIEELFLVSMKAMYELMGISVKLNDEGNKIDFSLIGDDRESLLVSFLSECLYFLETEQLVFHGGKIDFCKENLSASMFAKKSSDQAKEIKAVTYHQMEIEQTSNGYTVNIVFDV